jgi:TAT (twin-arginine translocation) pathway signal sequence
MAEVPKEVNANTPADGANPDRRSFMKGAAAAGLLGAVAMTPVFRMLRRS